MFLAFVCLHHWLLYSHRVSLCFTPFCADNKKNDADSQLEGFITHFLSPLIGFGWHLIWRTLPINAQQSESG